MKTFAKLISSKTIELAPNVKNGIINFNFNTRLMRANGYKELVKAELPSNDREYEIVYTEDINRIYESVNYTENETNYILRKNNETLQSEINILNSKINEIDLKRIRAICEPEIKDEDTGGTWLDYYNAQILELRKQLQEIQERINKNDIIE